MARTCLCLLEKDMIIGKIRAAVCVILALLCAISVVGCKKRADNSGVLEALGSMKEDDVTDTEAHRAAEYYQIIIPSACSGELSLAARRLADGIEENTDTDCGVFYDVEDIPSMAGAVQILLGNTNKATSRLALNDLRVGDYVCRFVNGALVIGGVSDDTTIAALERFMEEILPVATSECLMENDGGFEHIATYELKTVLLRGFDIGDYAVVYDDEECREFAEYISRTVARSCGRYLAVTGDGDRVSGKKEIAVSLDSLSEGVAYIAAENEDIIIGGADTYGVSYATAMFCELLFSNAVDGVASLESVDNRFSCRNDSVRVMHLVSTVSASENDLVNIIDLATMINGADADVFVFGDISPSAFETMSYSLSSKFEIIVRDGYRPIIYRKDRLTPTAVFCESQSCLEMMRVEFACSVTGEKYLVYNFCSDGSGASFSAVKDKLTETECTVALLTVPTVGGRLPELSMFDDRILGSSIVNMREQEHCLIALGGKERWSSCLGALVGNNDAASVTAEIKQRYSAEYLDSIRSENGVE